MPRSSNQRGVTQLSSPLASKAHSDELEELPGPVQVAPVDTTHSDFE
ncbi:hypothetical protein LILAB_15540 [Corallococcus macrosporus]|uniref:Uncharacterized protein n=1 Tax=Myxococcus fulvus (strain ATCC BAA-855 / HW-1) TaxID=483219 RepID=F8CIE5_MYXFH|nr:hypothetical protein LILAB_15540 [Corallococcus macrosporus]